MACLYRGDNKRTDFAMAMDPQPACKRNEQCIHLRKTKTKTKANLSASCRCSEEINVRVRAVLDGMRALGVAEAQWACRISRMMDP